MNGSAVYTVMTAQVRNKNFMEDAVTAADKQVQHSQIDKIVQMLHQCVYYLLLPLK